MVGRSTFAVATTGEPALCAESVVLRWPGRGLATASLRDTHHRIYDETCTSDHSCEVAPVYAC